MEKGIEYYCPIAFLVSCDTLQMDNVFPIWKEYIANEYIEDLQIETKEEQIVKYIFAFYGSNKNYFKRKKRKDIRSEFSCIDYLLNMMNKNLFYNENQIIDIWISLSSSLIKSLKCIIYPDKLEDNYYIKRLKENETVECISYKIELGRAPVSYNETVEKIIKERIYKNATI